MVPILPYLVIAHPIQAIGHIAEQFQDPVLTALVDLFYGLDQFLGGEFFEVAQDVRQLLTARADDHVKVAWHQAPGVDDQPFFLLAMAERIDDHMFQLPVCEQVHPAHRGDGDKVHALIIEEFVFL